VRAGVDGHHSGGGHVRSEVALDLHPVRGGECCVVVDDSAKIVMVGDALGDRTLESCGPRDQPVPREICTVEKRIEIILAAHGCVTGDGGARSVCFMHDEAAHVVDEYE
jgi:hypothetical protein